MICYETVLIRHSFKTVSESKGFKRSLYNKPIKLLVKKSKREMKKWQCMNKCWDYGKDKGETINLFWFDMYKLLISVKCDHNKTKFKDGPWVFAGGNIMLLLQITPIHFSEVSEKMKYNSEWWFRIWRRKKEKYSTGKAFDMHQLLISEEYNHNTKVVSFGLCWW
jgi:hypothetical protein